MYEFRIKLEFFNSSKFNLWILSDISIFVYIKQKEKV